MGYDEHVYYGHLLFGESERSLLFSLLAALPDIAGFKEQLALTPPSRYDEDCEGDERQRSPLEEELRDTGTDRISKALSSYLQLRFKLPVETPVVSSHYHGRHHYLALGWDIEGLSGEQFTTLLVHSANLKAMLAYVGIGDATLSIRLTQWE